MHILHKNLDKNNARLFVNLYIIVHSCNLQAVLVYEYEDINWISLDDVQADFLSTIYYFC